MRLLYGGEFCIECSVVVVVVWTERVLFVVRMDLEEPSLRFGDSFERHSVPHFIQKGGVSVSVDHTSHVETHQHKRYFCNSFELNHHDPTPPTTILTLFPFSFYSDPGRQTVPSVASRP